MLSIPTSLKQISPFRKELTYIIGSVKKEKLEGLRKKKKIIVEVPDGFFDFMVLCAYPVILSFVHVCIDFWFPLWLFLELDFLLWNIVLEVSGPVYNLITRNYATNFNMNFLEESCLHSAFTS